MTRIQASADPIEDSDPEYLEGVKGAVSAAIGYGIEVVERSEDRAPPIPIALLAQARLAARNRVRVTSLKVV
jgi:hypothetical protein